VFCSERCRLGDRHGIPDPRRRRAQVAAFAEAVRGGIAASGLPLRDLAARLGAAYPSLASSVATLSAWQTGGSAPPHTPHGRDRVLALERCLGLPAGDLALLLPGGPVVPAPRPPTESAGGPAARRARLAHLLTTLEGPQQVLPVAVTKQVRLGPGPRPVSALITLVLRAAHDGVDRFWYVDGADPAQRPVIRATAGCRAVRRVPEPGLRGTGLIAAELVLDRTLARGERHELSFQVRYEPGPPARPVEPAYRHLVEQPAERLDLSVVFDPRAMPAELLACRWRPRDGTEITRAAVTGPGGQAYRLVVEDPGPGGYGWRWAPAPVRLRAPRPGASAA
jgi:hypothetical protein